MKILKKMFLILCGYILFVLIIAGLESIIVTKLGMSSYILSNIEENTKYTLTIYLSINIVFWGVNYILNYKTVEKLNESLNIINKKGRENEK